MKPFDPHETTTQYISRLEAEVIRLEGALYIAERGLNAAVNQLSITHIALDKVRQVTAQTPSCHETDAT